MQRFTRIFTFVLCALGHLFAQPPDISAARIRAHVRFLSSDLMEGRGPGTRGEQLATEYIATQFALAGLSPAGDHGTYFQQVPLTGVETQPAAKLSATKDGQTVDFRWADEFVGVNEKLTADGRFEAEAIFVGHGIVAPEFQWDDFKGVDVRGKMLVLFTNEPPSDDPKFFGGRALTYYGRWSYKYEEATRRGALGVIIIHTTPTAGYGWDVVRNSWSREQPYVRLEPGTHALSMAGWVTPEAGDKLLALSGHHVDELLKAANARDFRPIPLGITIRGTLPSKVREIQTRNVAGLVEGSDPRLKSEVVIYSAHWDHLGIGTPVNGDAIYNGAVDNGTGCGILLELARAWAAQPQKPRRSALFLSVTAEEGGLRGSEFYAEHPGIPAAKIALDMNYDGLFPFGRTRDVVVNGAERTTAWPVVEAVATRMGLAIKPDPRPEQGSYYRSDHFSFAHVGIPAFSVEEGDDFVGKPAGFGAKAFEEYNEKHYHQPSDEFQESWDFSGLAEMARFGFLIGTEVANQQRMPTWRAGDEFLAAREKSGLK
ncbi:MAG TPA: M28 family peptidase [Bryobacteraceae bacterium]|nr:M28 family peptidase [Bryobacteraceae bacterium]